MSLGFLILLFIDSPYISGIYSGYFDYTMWGLTFCIFLMSLSYMGHIQTYLAYPSMLAFIYFVVWLLLMYNFGVMRYKIRHHEKPKKPKPRQHDGFNPLQLPCQYSPDFYNIKVFLVLFLVF